MKKDGQWFLAQELASPAREAQRIVVMDGFRYSQVERTLPATPERRTRTWHHFPSGWSVTMVQERNEAGWMAPVELNVFDGEDRPISFSSRELTLAALDRLGWSAEDGE